MSAGRHSPPGVLYKQNMQDGLLHFPWKYTVNCQFYSKLSKTDIAYRVHTRQIQGCSPDNLVTGGSRA